MKTDIFISYSRKDSKLVQIFHDELIKSGYKVWMDLDGIESSDAFKVKIVSAIKASQVFLFFSSCNSNSSEWTIKEVDLAVHLKKMIIPIKLDNSNYHDSLLFDLLGIDYISCTDSNEVKFAINRLLRTLIVKLSKDVPESLEQPKKDNFNIAENKANNRNHISTIQKNRLWLFALIAIIVIGIFYSPKLITTITTPTNSQTSNIKRGVNKEDLKKALFYYEEGLEAYLKEDFSTAVTMLRQSAELGYAKAQSLLGFCYAKGNGVEFSFKEAVKWYTSAAEQGDPEAQNKLGWCYQYGEGVEQSYSMAFDWNMKAALQGYAISQNNIGAYYFYGWGVDQSYELAHKWYTLAAKQGEPMSLYHLGLIYEQGLGVEVSIPLATHYYSLADAHGVLDAKNRLNALLSED